MNMLVETLGRASEHPLVWVAIMLIALNGLVAAYRWHSCPYLCGRAHVTQEVAQARLMQPFMAGPAFFVVMLGGIAAILAGLGLIDRAIEPVYGLLLVIAGVFVVQVEPARMKLRESLDRVVAAGHLGPEAIATARTRLRAGHLWLVSLNFVLAGAMTLGLVAF